MMNPDFAYIMGFLMADGCNEGHCVSIQLRDKDEYILHEFKKWFELRKFNTSMDERFIGSKRYVRLRIYSTKLCQYLAIRYGLTKAKSRVKLLKNIPINRFWDYIRGYFDGNGTITKRRRSLEVTFHSGSLDFIAALTTIITTKLNLKPKNINKHGGCYRVTFYSNEALKVLHTMYHLGNSELKLNRKFRVYKEYRKPPISKRFWTVEQIDKLIKLYQSGANWKEIANIVGKSPKAVSKKIWELKLAGTK